LCLYLIIMQISLAFSYLLCILQSLLLNQDGVSTTPR